MQSLLKVLLLPATTLVAAVRWFGNASVAARIAWIVALFQCVVVALAVAVVVWTGDRSVFQSWWSPGKAFALLLLLILVPVLVYQAARLWLERQDGSWADIAAAWGAAVAELERQQISLADAPVFLVLGSDGAESERSLFAESPSPLVVEQSPAGGGPLHLFASRDAIFVCISGAGQTGAAAAALRAAASSDRVAGPGDAGPGEAAAAPDAGGLAGGDRRAPTEPVLSSGKSRRQAEQRLEYACDLLRQSRIPLAAVNGVVVLLPLRMSRPADAESTTLGQAVGEDLATVTRVLGVRAPVTFVAGVLQDDPAIDELLGRIDVGKRATACGQAFPVGLPPTTEHLRALSLTATGTLSDHLAELLLDSRRIADQPANRHLLALLLRLVLHVSTQLFQVLQQAFAPDLHAPGDGRPGTLPLLAGCYLASIPGDSRRRAFVGAVLARVTHLQGELDWTDDSLRSEAWARRTSRLLFTAVAVMIAAMAAIIWWKLSR
ncbi:MAG: type VI secretion protein IcmF/TssM N-terminal domain-containing protein [Planctomycetota bacterium]